MDAQVQSPSKSSSVPIEVSGWLLALCLILTIVFPATSLYRIISYTIPTAMGAHTFNRVLVLSVYCLLFSAVAVFSFVAGLRLWLVKPHAVGLARRFLLVYLLANAAYFVFWIGVIRPSAFLWYTYLEHSKRVRNTYPVP